MLVKQFTDKGIGGCLATKEAEGRWGIVRFIYPPYWYAANQERLFGVDWARWARTPGDQNESKRLWCEHAALAISEAMREIADACIDSVLFDEYCASDRLGLWSKAAVRRLCAVNRNELPVELAKISCKPLPFSAIQRHWKHMAARKRVAGMLENDALWDEVQRLCEARDLAGARIRRTKPNRS